MTTKITLPALLLLIIVGGGIAFWLWPRFEPLPDFSVYQAGAERKEQFFAFITPLVAAENEAINQQRARLQSWSAEADELSWWQRYNLERLARTYRLTAENNTSAELIAELQLRVDSLPASLVLAQAAKESGWGTSRFAVEGNNLFGQWCYVKGCGLVPKRRDSDQKHEVTKFRTAQLSVRSYMLNLNTHYRYQDLRTERAQLRAAGATPSGQQLANHLLAYSEQGEDYVRSLQEIIRINKLQP